MKRTIRLRGLALATAFTFAVSACGSGGSGLADEADEKSTAACARADYECTTEYIAWFNRVSITQEDDLDALSAEDRTRYSAATLAAADCQTALR